MAQHFFRVKRQRAAIHRVGKERILFRAEGKAVFAAVVADVVPLEAELIGELPVHFRKAHAHGDLIGRRDGKLIDHLADPGAERSGALRGARLARFSFLFAALLHAG